MARTAKTQSSEQKDEAQRSDAQTSSDSTSMISSSSTVDSRLTAEQEQAQIKEQADVSLVSEPTNDVPDREMVKVKTLGAYMLQDPTTGYSVSEKGDSVPLSAFIQKALDEERIKKA